MWGYKFPKWMLLLIIGVAIALGLWAGFSTAMSTKSFSDVIAIGMFCTVAMVVVSGITFLALTGFVAFALYSYDKRRGDLKDYDSYFPNEIISIWSYTVSCLVIVFLIICVIGTIFSAVT
jgi:heme/copper-type cytochrome/quinol oxidase subunit 2